MKNNGLAFVLVTTIAIAIVGAGLSVFFSRFINLSGTFGDTSPMSALNALPQAAPTQESAPAVTYSPPSLQDAPPSIKEAVLLGYNLLLETGKYAPANVGNKLSCSNCHFKAGLTQGGKNGGLSLVGVGATYPQYRKRQDYAVSLVTRTNDCFKRSMNGRPLPEESKEMTAIVTYYQWISKGLPVYAEIPWLGTQPLQSTHVPDKTKGEQLYGAKCSACHGKSGEGTAAAPPLWGNDSFNDGAGMHKPVNMSAFALLNMPLGNPDLAVEEALDVADFVASQPRPHFSAK
ncbi:MAG: c-type cytochrome [Proteobacteria bacterium]|nr:c-type cytochrome [Pseudomonadota bacterium]MBU4298334.1 c-type cytochrome [Pseudomonadota bacterium]MCG2749838.1 c-type cytochrome [Desulfobulbaceae bacterium]